MSILSDAIERELPAMREHAESLMVDSCRITRPDPDAGPGEMDPETGEYPEPSRLTIYEGKCRVQDNRAQVGGSDSSTPGGAVILTQDSELQLPIVGSEDIAVDDVAEILTCAHDEAMRGRQFTIAARHHKTHATSRRLRIEEGTA